MGVNSLWDVIGPAARPVKLESLSRKRLAVDASIWIYQFLKAVRDGEGNVLPQSHIVGFFRRICKLLYFGILPVFVFDGGAPALKRRTINQRKERRHGKRESVQQLAHKLLAMQVQRGAEEMNRRPRNKQGKLREDMIYFEDLPNQQFNEAHDEEPIQKQDKPTSYLKTDEYHLPEIQEFKVKADDTRIMPEEEYEKSRYLYEHIDSIDFKSFDPDSQEFQQLPLETQFTILSNLRLKSRLRMGHTKEHLASLFPDDMDFSKFQIQQVQKRSFYTQKLLDISGMNENGPPENRIAGERDRKYVLVRNENGWSLSLEGEGSTTEHAISVEDEFSSPIKGIESQKNGAGLNEASSPGEGAKKKESDNEDEMEWDDVPLAQEESKEEKNFQIALIKSMYNESSMDNSYKEEEAQGLGRAISRAKDELRILQSLEQKGTAVSSDEEERHTEKIALSSHNDDKKRTRLSTSNDTITSNTHETGSEKIDEIDSDEPKLSLGKSFLFEQFTDPENDDICEVSNNARKQVVNGHASTPNAVEKINKNNVNVENFEGEYYGTNESKSKNKHGIVKENLDEEKKHDKHDKHEKHEEKRPKELPDWFASSNIEGGLHHNFSYEGIGLRKRKIDEDEEIGLISWDVAQKILDTASETPNEQRKYNDDDEEEEDDKRVELVEEDDDHISEPHIEQALGSINNEDSSGESEERKPMVYDYYFEEGEEENLASQMKREDQAHKDFEERIATNFDVNSIGTKVTEEQLLQEKYLKAKRDADEVTETMIKDVQELLKRFGIPYITAPMEAEAQCAELLKLNLVDGVITDDNDCFLFGGDKIYKNMFNQKQYVECYFMSDIKLKIGLTQDKLIELALLLGSDYTEGIRGIGPVLAMEIIAEFGNLKNFKLWFIQNSTSVKEPKTLLQKSLLNRIKNGKLFLNESFPDPIIFDAYTHPEVDKDKTPFVCGFPSLDQIRSFMMYNLGWSQPKVDEIMVPLIRDMNRKRREGTQATIEEFFPQEYLQVRKEINYGKRMKTAAKKLSSKDIV